MAKKKPTIEYKLPYQRKQPKKVEPWITIKGKQPGEVKHLPIQLWKRPEVGPWTFHPRRQPKKVKPSTIVNIKQPIAGRRKGKPVPPSLHTPLKPAPGRSPTLKRNIKKR